MNMAGLTMNLAVLGRVGIMIANVRKSNRPNVLFSWQFENYVEFLILTNITSPLYGRLPFSGFHYNVNGALPQFLRAAKGFYVRNGAIFFNHELYCYYALNFLFYCVFRINKMPGNKTLPGRIATRKFSLYWRERTSDNNFFCGNYLIQFKYDIALL